MAPHGFNRAPGLPKTGTSMSYGRAGDMTARWTLRLSKLRLREDIWTYLIGAGGPNRRSRAGDLEVLQWCLVNSTNGSNELIHLCRAAASRGHLDIVMWCRAEGFPWGVGVCLGTAFGSHFDVLKWCVANGCPWERNASQTARRIRGDWDEFKMDTRTLLWYTANGSSWISRSAMPHLYVRWRQKPVTWIYCHVVELWAPRRRSR